MEQKKRPRRVWSTDNVISNNLPTALFGRDDKNVNIGSTTKSSRVNRSLFDQEDDEMDEEDKTEGEDDTVGKDGTGDKSGKY